MTVIAVSSTIINNCQSSNIAYKEYIIIGTDTIEIKGKMSNTAYKDTTLFGTFNLKMLEFTTENDIEYKEKELVYYKEVDGDAFKIGTYIVTAVSENDSKEEVTVTAFDYGLKFAIPYVSALNYAGGTVTLMDVLNECCTACSVTLDNATIVNGDFIVDSNQFVSGELYGDVISQIALIGGCFATITSADKLKIMLSNTTTEVIEDYIELDDKRDTKPITCVSIGLSNVEGEETILKDDALVAIYGENWLNINDCPFSYTEAKREDLIVAILSNVAGFGYSSFVSDYSFKPYLELGDTIQFKNKAGTLVDSIILKIDTDYDNITLSAPSIISATVDYVKPESATIIAKRAEILVNKQEATITALVSTTSTLETSVTNLEASIDVLKADLDTNIVIVSVDSDNKPLATANTDINYIVKYVGEAITLQPTTSDTATGITATITDTYIRFAVDSSVAITTKDNKFTFIWEKTVGEDTYTTSKSITVSTIAQTTSYVESATEPVDTTVLWFDTTTNLLKRYETDAWVVVNDYSTDIDTINGDVADLTVMTNANEGAIGDIQVDLINNYSTNDMLAENLDTRDNTIIETLSNEITVTSTALEVSILNDINTNGVSKLINTLVTIDIEGIKVAVNTSAFNTLLNNVGLYCKDGSTIVAQFDKDGGLIKNLIVQGSITFPSITLIEYTDADSELGLGHFWNGV